MDAEGEFGFQQEFFGEAGQVQRVPLLGPYDSRVPFRPLHPERQKHREQFKRVRVPEPEEAVPERQAEAEHAIEQADDQHPGDPLPSGQAHKPGVGLDE